jgi:signal transduction histidine kinase
MSALSPPGAATSRGDSARIAAGPAGHDRDLAAYIHWLQLARLRTVAAILALAVLVHFLVPAYPIPVAGTLLVCAALLLLSACALIALERHAPPMRLLYAVSLVDLTIATTAIGTLLQPFEALLIRPVLLIVIAPVALLSVRGGLVFAAFATLGHEIVLGFEQGWSVATFTSTSSLVHGFMFFLFGGHCTFYVEWLERKNATLADLAQRLRESADEARRANAVKSDFVGAVSHELRSPLSTILGYLEMTLDRGLGPLTPEQADALTRTRKESEALLELITDLLDVNRFEAGRVPLQLGPVALGPLIQVTCTEIPEQWRRPGVALRVVMPPDLGIIETDPGKLRTVVRNLIQNALKFTDRGHVTVTAAARGLREITIAVADTGRGIPIDALEYIFDSFRQVPGTDGGGVGLGLHMVRRFVQLLGGTVGVTSTVGKGSTFTVTLPRRAPLRQRVPEHGGPSAVDRVTDAAQAVGSRVAAAGGVR